MEDKIIDMNIDDALIEKPFPFVVESDGNRERRFFLYPVTLGKLHLLKRHMDNLDINFENVKTNPYLEALRIVSRKKEEVCRVFAYHTLKRKRDIFDVELVKDTASFLKQNCTSEELATLLVHLLTRDNIEQYKQHLGISNENERMMRLLNAKKSAQKSKNDYQFGGRTIYGTLIDQACERYGWPYDYVVWGISLVNLQLLLADRVQSIFISDDEKKKIPSSVLNDDPDIIRMDNKENVQRVLDMDWR